MDLQPIPPSQPAPQQPSPSPVPSFATPVIPAVPSAAQQSWGVVISIVVIVLMIIIGAFYSWGKRIAEENALGEAIEAGVQ